jgi:outer membrane protein TolC
MLEIEIKQGFPKTATIRLLGQLRADSLCTLDVLVRRMKSQAEVVCLDVAGLTTIDPPALEFLRTAEMGGVKLAGGRTYMRASLRTALRAAFAAVLMLVSAITVYGSTAPLTVDQAVTIALENNPTIRNAQLEVEKGGTRVAAARTKRLPSLSVDTYGTEALNRLSFEFEEGAFGTYDGTPIPNRDTTIDIARTFSLFSIARITQPISQLYKINLGVKMNESALAVDREHERSVRQAIAREVKAAYFTVLSAEAMSKAADEAIETHEEVMREMNVRVAQKAALEADRLDSAARLASTRVTAMSARNGLATARQHLNYLMGRDLDTPLSLTGTPAAAAVPVAQQTVPLETRPDVKEAELRVDQARLDFRLKAAERIPDVSLTVSHVTPINVDAMSQNMASAGVMISYEPFTWGRRGAELTEKRHSVEQAENSLRDKRAAAQLDIAARRRTVEETAAQLLVKQMESDAARERLRVTRTRFNQQAARPDEMFAASASLTQATAREQEAVSAYWTARADYDKAIGEE